MADTLSIIDASKDRRSIRLEWSDGHISNFNYLWLRDNCPSDIHPTAKGKDF